MNFILLAGTVRTPAAVHLLIERRLAALAARQAILEATVRLRDDREASPRFHASVALTIPGPDVHATACDHTVGGAIRRALDAVETQIDARLSRPQVRRRSNLQHPATGRAGVAAPRRSLARTLAAPASGLAGGFLHVIENEIRLCYLCANHN